jgi:hypothetical protein
MPEFLPPPNLISVYQRAQVGTKQVNAEIELIWQELRGGKIPIPPHTAQDPLTLISDHNRAPYEATSASSGLTGGEIAIIVATPFLAQLGKETATWIWKEIFEPRLTRVARRFLSKK